MAYISVYESTEIIRESSLQGAHEFFIGSVCQEVTVVQLLFFLCPVSITAVLFWIVLEPRQIMYRNAFYIKKSCKNVTVLSL